LTHGFPYEKYPMVTLVTFMIGLFDTYGVNHSERVSKLSVTLGTYVNMQEDDLEVLELAGLLHDIGKVGIPENIRRNPGGLTHAEMFMMQQHPAIGLKILEKMNGHIDERVNLATYHHHENWDGSGYPEGLKGGDIPYCARIIRIADSYDAITHSRGYRQPVKHAQALDIMEHDQGDGRLYDPVLFRSFLSMMRGKKEFP
jgi:putative nucleotidyltransferase with HDIG domain